MLNVTIPKDRKKLEQQINALIWQISRDENEQDREIHQKALSALEEARDKEDFEKEM